MTALGLVVAVPAVLAYNWLVRRNKSIMEELAAFANDLHGYMMSDGRVKPRMGGAAPKARPLRRTAPSAAGSYDRADGRPRLSCHGSRAGRCRHGLVTTLN